MPCAWVFRKSRGKRMRSAMIPVEAPAARATAAAAKQESSSSRRSRR